MEKRWESHVKVALKQDRLHFQKAIRKYPLDSWIHEVLEEVKTLLEANAREAYWISHFQSNDPELGYNMTSGGDGGQTTSSEELSRRMKGVPKSPNHRQSMREAQQKYWLENSGSAQAKRQQLAERNKTEPARQASKEAQERRWAKWHEENPQQPKQLLTKKERGQRVRERMTGKKRGPYKNRGVKQGPRQTSVKCPTCGRTMKFISKRHKCQIT
jgi:hypothetical protein